MENTACNLYLGASRGSITVLVKAKAQNCPYATANPYLSQQCKMKSFSSCPTIHPAQQYQYQTAQPCVINLTARSNYPASILKVFLANTACLRV